MSTLFLTVVCCHTASELLLVPVTVSVQACQVVVGTLRRVSGRVYKGVYAYIKTLNHCFTYVQFIMNQLHLHKESEKDKMQLREVIFISYRQRDGIWVCKNRKGRDIQTKRKKKNGWENINRTFHSKHVSLINLIRETMLNLICDHKYKLRS